MGKIIVTFIVVFIAMIVIGSYWEHHFGYAPDSEGMHWDYSVICEGGFKYKVLGERRGTIQMLNSDGTRVKCDQIRY